MANINDKVTIFTAAMRNEFMAAYDSVRPTEEAPWNGFVQIIPSTARIEQYPWMSPPPRLKRWLGRRNYTEPDYSKYKIENLEYSAEQAIKIRDIRDDQATGFKTQMQAMANDVADFPGRESLKSLYNNGTCFDGSNFFASSHTIGTGNNALTADNASNDAATHTVVALIKTGALKPCLWQERQDLGLRDNSGSDASDEEKRVKFWYDYEGAPGFGFWWDAVKLTITDTPTVNEVENHIKAIELAFRGFKLDKADPADDDWWPHAQLKFTTESIVYIVNPTLENLFRAVLESETLQAGTTGGTKTNIYRGHGDLIVAPQFGS